MMFDEIKAGDMVIWSPMCVLVVNVKFTDEDCEMNCVIMFSKSNNAGELRNYRFWRDDTVCADVYREGTKITSYK